jgi:uncharacterized protein (TIGR03435 family)
MLLAIALTAVPPLAHAQPLHFEVATITLSRGEDKGMITISPGGTLRMGGATLKRLAAMAYGMNEDEIKGGPAWIGKEAYDVTAKPEPPDPGGATAAPGNAAWKRMQQRLQSLLAERFGLVVHKDAKSGPILALVVAKGGSRLQPTKQEGVPPGTMRSPTQIVGRAGTTQMLATVLTNWLGRPVEDRTGLDGNYDYTLTYAPDPHPLADAPPADGVVGPSVFTALEEQLGLKLEPARGSIETLVIDRVQKPSAN